MCDYEYWWPGKVLYNPKTYEWWLLMAYYKNDVTAVC